MADSEVADLAAGVLMPQQQELTRERFDANVSALSQKIDEVKGQLYETVNRNYKQFVHAFNFDSDLEDEIKSLQADLENMTSSVANGRLAQLVESAAEQRVLAKQLHVTRGTIAVLDRLSKINEHLSAFSDCFGRGQLDESAQHLLTAETMLANLTPNDTQGSCDPAIFKTVRTELQRQRSQLKTLLSRVWRESISWRISDGDGTAKTVLTISHTALGTSEHTSLEFAAVIPAMARLGMLQSKFDSFVKLLHSNFVNPLLTQTQSSLEPFVQRLPQSSKLSLVSAADSKEPSSARGRRKAATIDTGKILDGLSEIIEFCLGALLPAGSPALSAKRTEYLEVFGAALWPTLRVTIVNDFLAKCVTQQTAKPAFNDQVLQATDKFEDYLIKAKLLSDGVCELRNYAADAIIHQSNKKRQRLLESAREILTNETWNTVQVDHNTERGGLAPAGTNTDAGDAERLSERVYSLPTCHISMATQSLIQLVYSTLAEMSTVDPESAVQSFFAVRDMLDLFRAVVPYRQKEALATVPQTAVIFHNDCFYIAHHLLSLGHQFRGELPDELAQTATFIDLVPVFQELGERHFLAMLEKQKTELQESLKTCQGFGGTDDPARLAAVERGLKQVAHHLGLLSAAWKNVMATSLYDRSLGALVDLVLKDVVDHILRLEDISEAETHSLHRVLSMLLQKMVSYWPAEKSKFDDFVPSWTKFLQLSTLLQTSLRAMVDQWKAGELVFKADELRNLIRAIFANTDLRANCLYEIR
eukprot:m.12692 g.12692  ORF g.12692 m.12692 type:complete len:759 (+) comp3255_c0_seq2:29-2305(+)